ncbi:MAG: hypothetical protein LC660_10075 [Desulfobacteraceae bacterium]|nr:hypothetical protein [Desulfobacteraceae bacterium]
MFEDIEKLIPHRSPMAMIDRYQWLTEDSGMAEKQFSDQDYGCADKVVSQVILIECMAQTVAAHQGYKHLYKNGTEHSMGMLVAIDEFEFIHSVPDNAMITINIEKFDEIGSFHLIKGEILFQNKQVAKGRIKIFEMPPPQDNPQ